MHVSFLKRTVGSFLLLGFLFTSAPLAAKADHLPTVVSSIFITSKGNEQTLSIPSANTGSGGSLAVADLEQDGISEIITAAGIGNEPRIRIFEGNGAERTSFLAYAPEMGVGVNLTACDVNGDGEKEVITSPQRGGSPHIRSFKKDGALLDTGFFAYAEAFKGGVNLVCGEFDSLPGAELITLPAAGGGPHVRVWKWNGTSFSLSDEWFAGDSSDRRGLVGSIGPQKTLWLASSKDLPGRLLAYIHSSPEDSPTLTEERTLFAQDQGTGVQSLALQDETLLIGIAGISKIVTYTPSTSTWGEEISKTPSPVLGVGDIDGDGSQEPLSFPGRPLYGGTDEPQSIIVDLGEQRLYAYEYGILANTFLISAGKAPYKTPIGTHKILAKVDQVHYAGTDYDGTKWDLGWVPYNLRFYPHVYIHYAYWHNNFGHPMSHGCVNVNLTNMKWIYTWAQAGATVIVQT